MSRQALGQATLTIEAVIEIETAGRDGPRMDAHPSAAPRPSGCARMIGGALSALFHAAILAAFLCHPAAPESAGPPGPIPVELVAEPQAAAMPASAMTAAPTMGSMAAPATPEPRPIPPAMPAVVPAAQPVSTVAEAKPPRVKAAHRRAIAAKPAAPIPATAAPAGTPDASHRSTTTAAPAQAGRDAPPSPSTASATPAAAAPAGNAAAARHTAYLAAVVAWLERHKEYPDEARERREEGTALIDFTIDRAGKVLSFDIRRSSGFDALDRATCEMVRRSDPLPAAPASYPGARIEMVLPVTFALQ